MLKNFITYLFLLTISSPSFGATQGKYWEYTFRPGDSMWKIAKTYTVSVNNWKEIQKLNQIHQRISRSIPIGTRILIPVSMLIVQPVPAQVITLNGAASLVRSNGNKEQLKVGTLLYGGDRIVTTDHQTLRIQFADKSQLQVLPNSDVVMDKLSHHKESGMIDTQIRLNKGRINTHVEKQKNGSRYEVITPTAITAVRGTSFRKSFDDNSISRTEVTEGIVKVYASNSKKAVNKGYGIIAEKGKPLSDPIKLLEPPTVNIQQLGQQTGLQISWNKLPGAKKYRYQLSIDDSFGNLIENKITENNNITFNKLQLRRYYLKVRGIDQHQLEGIDSNNEFIILKSHLMDDTLKNIVLPTQIFMLNL